MKARKILYNVPLTQKCESYRLQTKVSESRVNWQWSVAVAPLTATALTTAKSTSTFGNSGVRPIGLTIMCL